MKNVHNDLYGKITQVTADVKESLRKKGLVVPVKNRDGSIVVGHCRIKKDSNGYYAIVDRQGDLIVGSINLPQTAAVLANALALGKNKDDKILEADKNYGFAFFDEQVHTRAVELSKDKPLERYELMMTKRNIARIRKENYRNEIVKSFEKLIKLV
jgi:hypothetical protein